MSQLNHLVPVLITAAVLVFVAVRLRQRGGQAPSRGLGRRRPTGAGSTTGRSARTSPVLGVAGLVAGREIRQRLRGRVFRVATVLLLVGVAAAIIIPAATKGKPHPQQVGVVGTLSQSERAAVATAAASVKADVRLVSESDTASAEDALRAGRIDVAIVDGEQLVVNRAVAGDATSQTATFVRALAQVLGVNKAIQAAQLTADQRAGLAGATPLPVAALQPARANTAGRTTALVALIVVMILLSQYLTWTLIGVMEEKSSRVIEVLLAAVRPRQLLAGKVIGIGVVVFAQAAVVVVFALLLARTVGSDLLHGTAPLVLLAALLWVLLGYAFYCWLYAAAGSMVERQDQVQSLAIPLALPLLAGYVVALAALGSGSPAPLYLEILAYLPPTAPFAMTALVGLGSVTWWQFTLSAVLTAASAVAMSRLAAAVYRRAILRTGRRVPLRELFSERSEQPG